MNAASTNAVTHGLFSRETVLPAHGEDPAEYAQFLSELTRDLRPQNLLERHCVQTIAAALWRLRRFRRWEAAHTPDPALTPDEQLQKMERAFRAEAGLHRRINTALKQLGRGLPDLLQTRARLPDPDVDDAHTTQNCQNGPPTAPIPNLPFTGDPESGANKERGLLSDHDTQNCQNEPEDSSPHQPEPPRAPHPSVLPLREDPCERSEQGGGFLGSRRAQLTELRAERARRRAVKDLHRV